MDNVTDTHANRLYTKIVLCERAIGIQFFSKYIKSQQTSLNNKWTDQGTQLTCMQITMQ